MAELLGTKSGFSSNSSIEEYLYGAIKTSVTIYAPGSHLSKWVFISRRNVTVQCVRWQSVPKPRTGDVMSKLLSPSRVFVLGTIHYCIYAVRYGAMRPWRDL